jgi:hypothetical protein
LMVGAGRSAAPRGIDSGGNSSVGLPRAGAAGCSLRQGTDAERSVAAAKTRTIMPTSFEMGTRLRWSVYPASRAGRRNVMLSGPPLAGVVVRWARCDCVEGLMDLWSTRSLGNWHVGLSESIRDLQPTFWFKRCLTHACL